MREMSYNIILNESYMLTGDVGGGRSARLRLTAQVAEGDLEKFIDFLVENASETENIERLAPHLPQIFVASKRRGRSTWYMLITAILQFHSQRKVMVLHRKMLGRHLYRLFIRMLTGRGQNFALNPC